MKKIAVIFMALALMIPFSTSFINVNAEDSDIIRNDETGIPDKNLYQWGVETYDLNKDSVLTQNEIDQKNNNQTSLSLHMNDRDIRSLKGIHYFDNGNIYNLDISGNKNLKSLDGIEELSAINGGLIASDCALESIEGVQKFKNLKGLMVDNNNLKTIPNLTSLINLSDMGCPHSNGNYDGTDFGWVCFYGNMLSDTELKNKLPKQISSNLTWLLYDSFLQISDGVVTVNNVNDDNLNVEYFTELLKNDNINTIRFYYLSKIPYQLIETLNQYDKCITVNYNTNNDKYSTYWELAPENTNTIKNDVDLTFTENSPYEKKIKEVTQEDNLVFYSFNANENIGKQQHFLGDTEYSVIASIGYENLDNPMVGNDLKDLYVYSYNDNTGVIKETGKVSINADNYLSIQISLEKNANTVFVSTNSNLATPIRNNVETISSDHIDESQISQLLNDENVDEIIVNINDADTLSKNLINQIKASGKTVTFNIVDNDKIKYSWSFDGSEIKEDYDKDINLNIEFKSIYEKEIENINSDIGKFYLQFSHHGNLPSMATMRVDVSDKFKDGDYVFLYYYNEDTKEVEKASQGIEVKNGYVEFVITHCSTYFLAEKELPTIEVSHEADNSNIEDLKVEDNQKIETTPVQTADSNQLLLPIIGIAISSIAIGYLFIKRRRA